MRADRYAVKRQLRTIPSCRLKAAFRLPGLVRALPLALFLFLAGICGAPAALQFDVFLGYDGIVPEASWFPVVCEVKNDGPSFNAMIEVAPGNYNGGQIRRVMVELPTGTLKRLVIPVFSSTRGYSTWDVRLIDERGKVRAEQPGLRASKQVGYGTPVVGALARTAGGIPTLKNILPTQSELQPAAARLQTPIFPDNPLVLEGMDSLYLSSEKAADLRVPNQVEALFAWLNAGGHLIVGVEQISDITGTKWLRELFPVDLKDIKTLERHPELQDWLRASWSSGSVRPSNTRMGPFRPPGQRTTRQPQPAEPSGTVQPYGDMTDDYKFETAPMQIAVGTVKDGRVVASTEDTPLIVTANRGRGRITALPPGP